MRYLILFAMIVSGSVSRAAEDEFDTLGGNRMLMERAQALDPDSRVKVVQNRAVDRRLRFELAPEVSGVLGGDTYSRTRSVGFNAYFHISPRWALGAKYNYSFNKLTPEGLALVEEAERDFRLRPESPSIGYPDVDYQKSEMLGLVNWYPLYGKFSILDRSVIHFDFYALAGGGRVQLRSGGATELTAGGGLGLWLTRSFSTRLEARYASYTGKFVTGPRRLDLTIASLQMGWLL